MTRALLFVMAVVTLYVGGFVYDEVGPLFYALALTLLASTPLLLKLAFWKKILLMLPFLVLRVIGKILLKVFGRNALSRLIQRYSTLEQRMTDLIGRATEIRVQALARWRRLSADKRGYLVLVFLPVAIVILLLSLVIRIVRLKFLQMLIEKLLQFGFEKASDRVGMGPASTPVVSTEKKSASNAEAQTRPANDKPES